MHANQQSAIRVSGICAVRRIARIRTDGVAAGLRVYNSCAQSTTEFCGPRLRKRRRQLIL
jgi:hypothetical protein